MLGYAGWSRGQLEDELKQDVWLAAPANRAMIFDCPVEDRYRGACLTWARRHASTAYAGPATVSKIVLGFDFGLARIGVATGQTLTKTATPLTILKAQQGQPDWTQVEQLVGEWNPDCFVVGLPLNMDESIGTLAQLSSKFARRLEGRFGQPAPN